MVEIKFPEIKKPNSPLIPKGVRALLIVIAVIILLSVIGSATSKIGGLRKWKKPSLTPLPQTEVSPTVEETIPVIDPVEITVTPPETIISPTETATLSARQIEVNIINFTFQPISVTASRESTIVWINRDTVAHTVTADDGSFDSGAIAPEDSFEQRFDKVKSYSYSCSFHKDMKGTITIQ